jgi:hypothetical protein
MHSECVLFCLDELARALMRAGFSFDAVAYCMFVQETGNPGTGEKSLGLTT